MEGNENRIDYRWKEKKRWKEREREGKEKKSCKSGRVLLKKEVSCILL